MYVESTIYQGHHYGDGTKEKRTELETFGMINYVI